MTETYSYFPVAFWPSLATAILVAVLGIYSWRRRAVPGARYFAGACLFWFLLLIWPGDTFGRPTYNGMANVMPEQAWALALLVSSVTQITIVVRQDFHCWLARSNSELRICTSAPLSRVPANQ